MGRKKKRRTKTKEGEDGEKKKRKRREKAIAEKTKLIEEELADSGEEGAPPITVFGEKYEVGEVLGRGAFSVVKKVTSKRSGRVYAVKIIDKKMVKVVKERRKEEQKQKKEKMEKRKNEREEKRKIVLKLQKIKKKEENVEEREEKKLLQ